MAPPSKMTTLPQSTVLHSIPVFPRLSFSTYSILFPPPSLHISTFRPQPPVSVTLLKLHYGDKSTQSIHTRVIQLSLCRFLLPHPVLPAVLYTALRIVSPLHIDSVPTYLRQFSSWRTTWPWDRMKFTEAQYLPSSLSPVTVTSNSPSSEGPITSRILSLSLYGCFTSHFPKYWDE